MAAGVISAAIRMACTDNGGTVIVDASGRRGKRMITDGKINVQW
jgi:hypothetical protein